MLYLPRRFVIFAFTFCKSRFWYAIHVRNQGFLLYSALESQYRMTHIFLFKDECLVYLRTYSRKLVSNGSTVSANYISNSSPTLESPYNLFVAEIQP